MPDPSATQTSRPADITLSPAHEAKLPDSTIVSSEVLQRSKMTEALHGLLNGLQIGLPARDSVLAAVPDQSRISQELGKLIGGRLPLEAHDYWHHSINLGGDFAHIHRNTEDPGISVRCAADTTLLSYPLWSYVTLLGSDIGTFRIAFAFQGKQGFFADDSIRESLSLAPAMHELFANELSPKNWCGYQVVVRPTHDQPINGPLTAPTQFERAMLTGLGIVLHQLSERYSGTRSRE